MKYWFMSYVYKSRNATIYGSYVVKTNEHPAAIIKRWNKEHDRQYCLLSFQEMNEEDAALLDYDSEV